MKEKEKEKAAKYKPVEDREKDLKLALYRIQNGRAHTRENKVTIAAVAREAGVSTALIHNHYQLRLFAKFRGAPVAPCVM